MVLVGGALCGVTGRDAYGGLLPEQGLMDLGFWWYAAGSCLCRGSPFGCVPFGTKRLDLGVKIPASGSVSVGKHESSNVTAVHEIKDTSLGSSIMACGKEFLGRLPAPTPAFARWPQL